MRLLVKGKGRYITIAVFTVLAIISAILMGLVKTNYDMTKYLPDNSNTKKSLELMTEEFGQTSMIQLMTTNVNLIEANDFVVEITKLPTIKSVVWLGVMADISVPIEHMDQEVIKDFYHEGKLLYTIEFNLDDYAIEIGTDINHIKETAKAMGIEVYMRGAAVNNKSNRDKVNNEMFWIFVLAVPIAIAILFIASKSWFEPIIVLINLGISILINMGTNFIQGEISYITLAITSVLQMAMSLDFSLFLIHRYYEERENNNKVDAIVKSTKAAFKSVTASALTTIFGFLALIVMQYRIGFDIGVSLAKAILISYLVTMIFLPVIIVVLDKPLMKLKRNKAEGSKSPIIKFIYKYRVVLTIFIVAFGSFMFYTQTKTNYIYGDLILEDYNDQAFLDELAIKEEFGSFQPVVVLYRHEDKQQAITLAEELMKIPEVTQIQSLVTSVDPTLPENIIPQEALDQFKGINYSRMIIMLDVHDEDERMYELSETLTNLVYDTLPNEPHLLGVVVSIEEIKTSVTNDGLFVQLLSALIIAVVIGILFKSAIIPVLLVILIEISIWTNISFSVYSGGTLVYIGYLVVSSLQLGATIDYAVLLTSRYQEFRETLTPKEAMFEAFSKSWPTIIVSGLVLAAAGFVVYFVSKLGIIKEIGMLIGRGALISGAFVLLILPAILLIFDKLILKLTFNKRREKSNEKI